MEKNPNFMLPVIVSTKITKHLSVKCSRLPVWFWQPVISWDTLIPQLFPAAWSPNTKRQPCGAFSNTGSLTASSSCWCSNWPNRTTPKSRLIWHGWSMVLMLHSCDQPHQKYYPQNDIYLLESHVDNDLTGFETIWHIKNKSSTDLSPNVKDLLEQPIVVVKSWYHPSDNIILIHQNFILNIIGTFW